MPNNLISDVISTQQQLGYSDTTIPLFSLFSESLACSFVGASVIRQNLGHAWVLNHLVNGKIGTANGLDGSQIRLGPSSLGTSSVAWSG
jgi:hypothetical protein